MQFAQGCLWPSSCSSAAGLPSSLWPGCFSFPFSKFWYLLCSFLPHAFVLVSSPLSSAVMVVKERLFQLQPFLGLALFACVLAPDDG